MTRVTKGQILIMERRINEILCENGYFNRLYVEWAYGRPRVYLRDENKSMVSELSPRLSTGPLLNWLDAFLKGLCMGLLVQEDQECVGQQ